MGEETEVSGAVMNFDTTIKNPSDDSFHFFLISWTLFTQINKSDMQRSAESITAAWYTYTYRLKPFKEDKISSGGTQVIELRNSKGASQESQGVTAAFSR